MAVAGGRSWALVPFTSAELTSAFPVFRVRSATVGAHLAHVAPRRGEAARPTKAWATGATGDARLGRGAATANSRVGCFIGGTLLAGCGSQRVTAQSP